MVIIEKQAKGGGRQATGYCHSLAAYMRTAKRHPMAEEYGISLATYMRFDTKERTKADDRVLATGALVGGTVATFDAGHREMERRLAGKSKRSKKPARHLIASFRKDEEPTAEDCYEVVRILGNELDCEDGVLLWALHGDTDNRHLHILVLTLDAAARATRYGPQGQSHEAMQRAIARLEHAQKLTPERGSRYVADENSVRRREQVPRRQGKRAPIRTETLQWEDRTGLESFTRYAQEVFAPILDQAESWAEAQAGCAEHGGIVRKAGSGGELQGGDGCYKVRLSNVDRKLSWAELTRRWGEWSEPDVDVQPYRPRVLDPIKAAAWVEADERRSAAHDAVQRRIDRLRSEKKAAIEALGEELAARRAELGGLDLVPIFRAEMFAALDAIYETGVGALQSDYDDRITAVRELRDQVDACASPADIKFGEIGRPDVSLSVSWPSRPATPAAHPDYRSVVVGKTVQYWATAGGARQPAFVERGNRIWINDGSNTSLAAALIVAQARYGDVAAHGDPAFIKRAQALGRQLGMVVQIGVVVSTPPPRRRSPRREINRAVARAAAHELHSRATRSRAAASALYRFLFSHNDDERRTTLPLEIPRSPPDMPVGFERLEDTAAYQSGIVIAPLAPSRGMAKRQNPIAEPAPSHEQLTSNYRPAEESSAQRQRNHLQWRSIQIDRKR